MSLSRTLGALIALSLAGLGISLYLTSVYTAGGIPVCLGGSSGCSEVQASPYAWIGPVPIPALGALMYVLMIALAAGALASEKRREALLLALFGVSLAGVVFSAYLTYLELYVILAICTWCVASAIVMVLVFLASLLAQHQFNPQPQG